MSEVDWRLSCDLSDVVRARRGARRKVLSSSSITVVPRRKSMVCWLVRVFSLTAAVPACSEESQLGDSGYALERELFFDFRPKRICFAFRDPAYYRSEEFCAEFADDGREVAEVSSYPRRIANGAVCTGVLSVKCSLYLTLFEDSCPDSLAVTVSTVEPDFSSEIDGICGTESLEVALPAQGAHRGEPEGRQ